jgi:hypothetical protein
MSRADLDGSRLNLQSNFMAAPTQVFHGYDPRVSDGPAADQSHIYVSRFFEDSIGRASLDGSGIDTAFVVLTESGLPSNGPVSRSGRLTVA